MIRIHVVAASALVFDLSDVRSLRSLGITGVLVGTLPRAPQQNVFLGLPLQLSVYEATWLVANGHAHLVDGALYNDTVAECLGKCRDHVGDLKYAVTPDVFQAPRGKCDGDKEGGEDMVRGDGLRDLLNATGADAEMGRGSSECGNILPRDGSERTSAEGGLYRGEFDCRVGNENVKTRKEDDIVGRNDEYENDEYANGEGRVKHAHEESEHEIVNDENEDGQVGTEQKHANEEIRDNQKHQIGHENAHTDEQRDKHVNENSDVPLSHLQLNVEKQLTTSAAKGTQDAAVMGPAVDGDANIAFDACVMTLSQFLARQTLPDAFSAKYSAFSHLRSRDFYMMPGLRFGGVFVAYPGDPLQFHSHLIVKVLQKDENVDLLELVTSGRLATAVKKAWVLIGEDTTVTEEAPTPAERLSPTPMRAFSIEWAGFG